MTLQRKDAVKRIETLQIEKESRYREYVRLQLRCDELEASMTFNQISQVSDTESRLKEANKTILSTINEKRLLENSLQVNVEIQQRLKDELSRANVNLRQLEKRFEDQCISSFIKEQEISNLRHALSVKSKELEECRKLDIVCPFERSTGFEIFQSSFSFIMCDLEKLIEFLHSNFMHFMDVFNRNQQKCRVEKDKKDCIIHQLQREYERHESMLCQRERDSKLQSKVVASETDDNVQKQTFQVQQCIVNELNGEISAQMKENFRLQTSLQDLESLLRQTKLQNYNSAREQALKMKELVQSNKKTLHTITEESRRTVSSLESKILERDLTCRRLTETIRTQRELLEASMYEQQSESASTIKFLEMSYNSRLENIANVFESRSRMLQDLVSTLLHRNASLRKSILDVMNSLQQIMCTKQHEHESYCSCIERRFFEEMIRAKRSEVRLQGIISDLKDKQDCLIREIYQNRANVRSERILVQKEIEALEVHIGNMQRLIDKIGSAKQAQNLSHSAALEELFRTHQAKLTTVECAFKEQLHHVRKDLEARNLELEKRAGTTSKARIIFYKKISIIGG
mmetsp:Transcript_12751/g.35332  ORF Transcript_12751/g.35332 Transcript_12751/m.35332 type:complete len:573 (-) Transcript_12751:593-2311(-)